MTSAMTLPMPNVVNETPEPGIYPGMSFERYQKWPYMNASTLVEGTCSMLRMKAKIDGTLPSPDSDAMRFGRAVHCRLLEPDEFALRFQVPDRCIATLKAGKKSEPPKQCSSRGRFMTPEGWVCGTHAPEDAYQPADFITAEEAGRIEGIKQAAFHHKEIQHIRSYPGSEVSIVFDLCGVRCKARLDKLIQAGGGFVIDVKTTSKPITEHGWSRQIVDFNYHLQAAFYLQAVKATIGLSADFWWCVVETTPPFDVAAIRLPDFDRQVGTWEVKRLLRSFDRCMASGEWPGAFPELVEHVGLPSWKAKEYSCVELGE